MAFVPGSMLRNYNNDHHHHHHEDGYHSFISSSSFTPQNFQGLEFSTTITPPAPFISGIDRDRQSHEHDDDTSDDGSQLMLGEKKRRLNAEQVKALERSFELGNKLEPERKLQLARALGLQPRQIAIWFQNRRARWKTKQLERDYNVMKREFEAIKADNDALKSQNKKLHAQLMALKGGELTALSPFNLNHVKELNTNGQLRILSSSQSQGVNDLTRQEEQVQMCHDHHHHATDGSCNNAYGAVAEVSEYWPW